jgi:hypothetical protein
MNGHFETSQSRICISAQQKPCHTFPIPMHYMHGRHRPSKAPMHMQRPCSGAQRGHAGACRISPSAGRGGETIFISAAFERSADSSLRARLCGRAAAATAAMAPFESLYMKIASEGLGLLVSSHAVQGPCRWLEGGDCSSTIPSCRFQSPLCEARQTYL